ncbi:MAG: hypothetical protein V1491_00460 [archaeon]
MNKNLLSKIKKIYVKKICDIDIFSVWFVNGECIRTNINEEFTNYGQSYSFNFIPANEFWIDKEAVLGEEKYYIDSMLMMNQLIAKGISHKDAVKKADMIEKRERAKGVILAKGLGSLPKEELLRRVKKYCNKKISVWIVDGELVRSLFFLDFTEGGHDRVYKFIPDGEIWIDNDVSVGERKFILVHEAHERNLMIKGVSYDDAHRDSSRIEFFCRHHPKKVDEELKKELRKYSK